MGMPDLLPRIIPPGGVLAAVQSGPLSGCPVILAGHDSWACALGLGAMRHGRAYNISGTSEVLGVLAHHAAPAEGLISADWGNGLHQLGGPSASGGATIAWAMGVLAPNEAVGPAMDRLLAAPGSPLLFLPHLAGERAPYWDPDLRGAFLGLAAEHGAADLARAVAEGVGFMNRAVLQRAEIALALEVDEIRYGGGGAASPGWAQIKADITGRPVLVTEAAETGLLGAAIAGWRALGHTTAHMVQIRSRHLPDPARHARYTRLWALWQQAGAAVRPISHALAHFPAA
jgi:xylulokinase